jgi:hypothetical protein
LIKKSVEASARLQINMCHPHDPRNESRDSQVEDLSIFINGMGKTVV